MRSTFVTIGALTVWSARAFAGDSAEDLMPTANAADSAAVGTMLPLVESPGTPASVINVSGIYDTAAGGSSFAIEGQANLSWHLVLAAGAGLEDDDVSSNVALQFQRLDRDKHIADLQLALGWIESGINDVHAIFSEVGFGGHTLGGYTFATARFELGLEDNERGAAFGLGSMYSIRRAVFAGVNGALTLDLHPGSRRMEESSWSLLAGPAMTYVVDRYSITASGGMAADAPRIGPRELGVYGSLGVGAAF